MERLTRKQKDVIYWGYDNIIDRTSDSFINALNFHKGMKVHKGVYRVSCYGSGITLINIYPRTIDSLEFRGYLIANMSKEEEKVQIALGVIQLNSVCWGSRRFLQLTKKGINTYKCIWPEYA